MYLNDIYTIGANLAGRAGDVDPVRLRRRGAAGRPADHRPAFRARRSCSTSRTRTSARPTGIAAHAAGVTSGGCCHDGTGKPSSASRSTRSSRRAARSSRASPTAYGAAPNTQANLVDLGYPGVLPVLNGEAVRMAVKFGLAIGASVARALGLRAQELLLSGPAEGLPDQPVRAADRASRATGHRARRRHAARRIGITRAHLEEDAGKSLHEDLPRQSGIDLNRAGTPLLEIVSEPDMRSAKEAVAYMKKMHTLVRYLEICDGNMQEGSFRCDANVSVRRRGAEKFGTRAEIKNLNSFRFVEKAINYEVARQIELIEGGGKVRAGDAPLRSRTRARRARMRSKEEAQRLPLLPRSGSAAGRDRRGVHRERARDVAGAAGPEGRALRGEARPVRVRRGRADRRAASWRDYYESRQLRAGQAVDEHQARRQLGDGRARRRAQRATTSRSRASRIDAQRLAGLLGRIADSTISGKIAKDVFEAMWAEGKDADAIIESKGLRQITDTSAPSRRPSTK